MICLLLVMTTVFIDGTESVQQRMRHADTSLKEEEMSAKTKAWLLMVESGKVDQDELRRITPKSIFIAPLLTGGGGKCKEGYRHDHLGQCVKVIKMDPKVQLELLLQRLNKLYGEKASEEGKEGKGEGEGEGEEEKEEGFQESNGPLQFSLPISGAEEKQNASQTAGSGGGGSANEGDQPLPEFIPIPLPFVYQNRTNQTKEMESSGAGPLNETEAFETSQFEGSGEVSSGDEPLGDETTTESPVTLLSDDYLDDNETVTAAEEQTTTESPGNVPTTTVADVGDDTESYQTAGENATDASPPQEPAPDRKESDRIVFPTDDAIKSPIVATAGSSRIRFPDELQNSYQPEVGYKLDKYQIHSSAIPQQQFWWLPKNWEIDRSQQKSALVKVWSRLPLIHDITYSQATPDGFKPPPFSPHDDLPPQDPFPVSNLHHRSPDRTLTHFKTNRFHDILENQRRSLRIHR